MKDIQVSLYCYFVIFLSLSSYIHFVTYRWISSFFLLHFLLAYEKNS